MSASMPFISLHMITLNSCKTCAQIALYGSKKYPYPPQGRSLKIPRGRGSRKPKFLKESMKLNWKLQGVGGFKPSMGVWIFSGTTQYRIHVHGDGSKVATPYQRTNWHWRTHQLYTWQRPYDFVLLYGQENLQLHQGSLHAILLLEIKHTCYELYQSTKSQELRFCYSLNLLI